MMRKIALMGATILLIFAGLGGFCGFTAARTLRGVLNGLKIENWELKITRWCFGGLPLVDQLDKLLGDKTYIVLLQNNTELRPSGGFMGSYAKLKTQNSKLKTIEVEDIYQPDGQVVGYIEPPAPIKKAFPFGSWKLRDANWDVDFSVAGEQVAWFLEQGGESVDGVIAVNLSFVNSLLSYLGDVKTITYDERVTAQNLRSLAQTYSEVHKEKRDFLGAVGAALFEKIKTIGPIGQLRLIGLIYRELQKGQILVWMKDKDVQREVVERGWGGTLGNYGGDYLYIVEANLGANKANCCVTRSVVQSIDGNKEKLSIKWENNSQFSDPKPPVFWGGNYIAYVRVVVPVAAEIANVDKYDIETRGRFKVVGFWVTVPTGGEVTAEVIYDLPAGRQVLVRRQPGIESFPYRLVVDGKVVVSDTIDRDKEYTWTK